MGFTIRLMCRAVNPANSLSHAKVRMNFSRSHSRVFAAAKMRLVVGIHNVCTYLLLWLAAPYQTNIKRFSSAFIFCAFRAKAKHISIARISRLRGCPEIARGRLRKKLKIGPRVGTLALYDHGQFRNLWHTPITVASITPLLIELACLNFCGLPGVSSGRTSTSSARPDLPQRATHPG